MKDRKIRVHEIVNAIHKFANPQLAEKWDNVGLMLGEPNNIVKKVLLALDLTEKSAQKAIDINADMIITHHPAIFRPLSRITNPLYIKLIKNDIAVLSAHTNFDVVKGGVNTALAERLNLTNLEFITNKTGTDNHIISVIIPPNYVEILKENISKAGGAIIQNYNHCFSSTSVKGEFMPNDVANPSIGQKNKLAFVNEIKLDFLVEGFRINKMIKVIEKCHPYEIPVFYITKLELDSRNYGLGFFGELDNKMKLSDFANFVKKQLKAPSVNLWLGKKSMDFAVKRIAISGGSGSSLLGKVIGKADVFLSADFTYHTIIDCPIPLIDAGHFYTEQPVLDKFAKLLQSWELEIAKFETAEHEISKLVRI